jgi:hypothetical protein
LRRHQRFERGRHFNNRYRRFDDCR